jgi:hypothetical protein
VTGLQHELHEAAIRAATVAMTRRGEGLPTLHWSADPLALHRWKVTGTAKAGTPGEEVERAVRAWSDRLGLTLTDTPLIEPGLVEAKGVVDEVDVEVWGVVDREVWDTWLQGPAGDR